MFFNFFFIVFLVCKDIFAPCRHTVYPGNTKGGSITVLLNSCLTGLDWSVLQIKIKIVSRHTADSKQVKQEVNGTVILPPLVFPGLSYTDLKEIRGRIHNTLFST
jgi:hypothetical protein